MKKLMTLVLAVCMLLAATTAFAAETNFTPSVSAKSAPGVLKAWIEDEAGNFIKGLILDEEIVFTAVSDLETVEDEAIAENLKASYEQILNAESLTELGLEGVENMIVRDLFEVTLYGVTIEEGYVLKVLYETELPHAVAVKGEEGWTLCLDDHIEESEDGTVTVTKLMVGTVAFLVEVAAQTAVTSPAT